MSPENDQDTIFRFFTEVGIIHQLISTKVETFLPGRMSATQFGLLGHLGRRPDGETPLQLASAFQVPKTSMTHMLAGLHGLGFIAIDANPRDKRSKIARITPQGAMFQQRVAVDLQAVLTPILHELGITPFAGALPGLEQIRIALDAERDEA